MSSAEHQKKGHGTWDVPTMAYYLGGTKEELFDMERSPTYSLRQRWWEGSTENVYSPLHFYEKGK